MNLRQMLTTLQYIERGGAVQRMHTIPTLHSQNVAAHSFGVAWWAYLLSDGQPSVNLLMAALEHDLAEAVIGDIPSPSKRKLETESLVEWEAQLNYEAGLPVFELTEDEAVVLKLSDLFELVQHCIRERHLGNQSPQLIEMYYRVLSYASEIINKAAKTLGWKDNMDIILRNVALKWENQNG